MMWLPSTVPEQSPEALWSLQMELLGLAETLLGPRDQSKRILPPQFKSGGPNICHTPSYDGAFVELSPGAVRYWPTVVYEMAHESIHLLNPTLLGGSNYLEEGLAVEFSILAQQRYQVKTIQRPTEGPYFDALSLVRKLPDNPIGSGRLIREHVGALSVASMEQLAKLFPNVELETLQNLVEKFG